MKFHFKTVGPTPVKFSAELLLFDFTVIFYIDLRNGPFGKLNIIGNLPEEKIRQTNNKKCSSFRIWITITKSDVDD